ncbi:copper resistance CopC/CopD family protein, partial [Jatrophihabitans endophyticus]|uniref:copper resistance CopC/CopD family protein n=1 Tax=Jatrophihabitans endophyticus TaxID=1206085 RepID=UPI0019E88168
MKRFVALLGLLAGLLGAGLLLADPALAHASVVGSNPVDGSRLKTAPSQVSITFDEDVTFGGIGYLHVTNQQGQRVDAGAAFHPGGDGTKVADRLKKGLGDGSYTESWRVISADSHPVAGTIAFVVGHGALVRTATTTSSASNANTSTAFDVARWISYAGLALLGGTWLLLTVWPEGRDDERASGLVWSGVGVTALGAVLELVIQGPFAAGGSLTKIADGSLLDDTLHSTYGELHCVRLVLIGLLALVLVRALWFGSYALPRALPWVAGALGAGIAYTFSASGHADTTTPNGLSIPADMLHLLSMGAWLGGLIMLLSAVLPRREPDELHAVLPVFSRVAFTSVVALAVTGTYAAWRGVGTVHALFSTSYGLLVSGKVVLFLALVALGNLSRGVV